MFASWPHFDARAHRCHHLHMCEYRQARYSSVSNYSPFDYFKLKIDHSSYSKVCVYICTCAWLAFYITLAAREKWVTYVVWGSMLSKVIGGSKHSTWDAPVHPARCIRCMHNHIINGAVVLWTEILCAFAGWNPTHLSNNIPCTNYPPPCGSNLCK